MFSETNPRLFSFSFVFERNSISARNMLKSGGYLVWEKVEVEYCVCVGKLDYSCAWFTVRSVSLVW